MAKSKQTKPNYEQLKTELDTILTDLQQGDLDIDQALKAYERGLELVRQLEAHLKNADNKIRQLKTKFNDS